MNAISLPQTIRSSETRRRRRPIIFREIRPSLNQASALASIFLQVVRFWQEMARNQIMPAYAETLRAEDPLPFTGDAVSDIQRILGSGDDQVYRLILRLTPALNTWAVRAERLHRAKFVANAKTAAGVDLSTVLTESGVQTTVSAVLERNVALITKVSETTRASISEAVFAGIQNRTPRFDVAKAINEITGIGRDRSLLIASDQSTKFSATLDRERQEEIGITQFKWLHSGKVHFRPIHKARDGKVFSWDDASIANDLPGMAINCGCKAQAYIEGIT